MGNWLAKRACYSATFVVVLTVVLMAFPSCSDQKEHMAPAVHERDSMAFMQARGICNLISDSGVIRYKIIAEEWNIYTVTHPQKWTFVKGILLEKFNLKFHVEWYVQADTAYCYNQNLWELRSRVVIRNQEGTVFHTEVLFWDMGEHQIYSPVFMRVTTPDRELQGYRFRSNESMTKYVIYNSKGSFPVEDQQNTAPPDSSLHNVNAAKQAAAPPSTPGTRQR
jgi:LPS export ABC transporter protein LptC